MNRGFNQYQQYQQPFVGGGQPFYPGHDGYPFRSDGKPFGNIPQQQYYKVKKTVGKKRSRSPRERIITKFEKLGELISPSKFEDPFQKKLAALGKFIINIGGSALYFYLSKGEIKDLLRETKKSKKDKDD